MKLDTTSSVIPRKVVRFMGGTSIYAYLLGRQWPTVAPEVYPQVNPRVAA